MKDSEIIELNNTAKILGLNSRVHFYNADIIKVVGDIAPFGKIAAVYTKNTFSDFGKDVTNNLKCANIKPLNFIMPENAVLNLSSVFDIICVPDDVRAVLIFDRELMDLAAYIATLFKIPVIFALDCINTDGVLCAKVPFFWGANKSETDFFSVDCEYHVVISDNACMFGNKTEQYISIYCKILSLIDYRIRLAICSGNSYEFERNIILNAIRIANFSYSANNLLISGLKIELANLASGGEILFNSAEYSFKRLTGFKEEKDIRFSLIKKLINLYSLCVSEKDMPFTVPDYNKRVKELADITKSDDGVFLKGFAAQIKALKGKDLLSVKADLKDDINLISEEFKVVEENYSKLGGNPDADFASYVKALKLCGDLPDTVNFMTVIRESGFLE